MKKPEKIIFAISPTGFEGSETARRSEMVFKYIIYPAAQKAGYTAIGADMISVPGNITSQIIEYLIKADISVAYLSSGNSNVMYELGIRHASHKPVIHLIDSSEKLPFDMEMQKTIVFNINNITSFEQASKALFTLIKEIEKDPSSSYSPYAAILDVISFKEASAVKTDHKRPAKTDSGSIVANILMDIDSRFKTLEYRIEQSQMDPQKRKQFSKRIFIVHGHDGEMKNELARMLEKLDFIPVILHELPDKGRTIYQKLTSELSDIGFAFILLSPDDLGTIKTDRENLKPRARQNVIFEHGLFAGFLKPERVCAICKGNVEIPSDMQGILYKSIPEGGVMRSISLEIVGELRGAGYIVDANKLLTL